VQEVKLFGVDIERSVITMFLASESEPVVGAERRLD
jgi:hypothetical protein